MRNLKRAIRLGLMLLIAAQGLMLAGCEILDGGRNGDNGYRSDRGGDNRDDRGQAGQRNNDQRDDNQRGNDQRGDDQRR